MLRLAVLFVGLACLAVRAETPPVSPAPETWQRAIGPWAWSFPRDHGAHPNFKTEWWYFTGNLQDKDKHRFGYQLTIFRQGLQFKPVQADSQWAARDFYFGHFTITDIDAGKFRVAEKVSRGALGEARAGTCNLDVKLGPWQIGQLSLFGQDQYLLTAKEGDMQIDFATHALKPVTLEGVGGLSRKADGEGEASYYYSFPRLATTGTLQLGGKSYDVKGLSWFDHEFSTSSLGKDQVGWDWFCVQLENNEEIMLYALRDKSGAMDPVSEGTWIKADGTTERLVPGSFTIAKLGSWRSPHTGTTYPAGWHILVPSHQADLTVQPALADQELHLTRMGTIDYWEGACTITGKLGDTAIKGVGYTELTGYAGGLQAGLKE